MNPDTAWKGITALYADPAVAQELIRRQDVEGLDVVLHLFAQWCAAQGRPLNDAALADAAATVADWRAQVIAPLRGLRRSMKTLAAAPALRDAVRSQVQAAELAAERAQVAMLCAWLDGR
ncbi:MAG: TIGR02444 family protein [Acidovorax sp.]